MRLNEYRRADVIEISAALDAILGWKDGSGIDSSCNPPIDRLYVEIISPEWRCELREPSSGNLAQLAPSCRGVNRITRLHASNSRSY